MSQIATILTAGASLIDDSAPNSDPFMYFLTAGFIFTVIGLTATYYFEHRKMEWPQVASALITFVGAVSLLVSGGVASASVYDEAADKSNSHISEYIQEKYGVTVLNKNDIGVYARRSSENPTVSKSPIPAKDSIGERIQITIELTDNNTDVLAFSSGAEMKKVSK